MIAATGKLVDAVSPMLGVYYDLQRGPRTDPCGTPYVSAAGPEQPLTV